MLGLRQPSSPFQRFPFASAGAVCPCEAGGEHKRAKKEREREAEEVMRTIHHHRRRVFGHPTREPRGKRKLRTSQTPSGRRGRTLKKDVRRRLTRPPLCLWPTTGRFRRLVAARPKAAPAAPQPSLHFSLFFGDTADTPRHRRTRNTRQPHLFF